MAPFSYGLAYTAAVSVDPDRTAAGSEDQGTGAREGTARSAVVTVVPGTAPATTARSRPVAELVYFTATTPVLPVVPEPTVTHVVVPAFFRCRVTLMPPPAPLRTPSFFSSLTVTVAVWLVL